MLAQALAAFEDNTYRDNGEISPDAARAYVFGVLFSDLITKIVDASRNTLANSERQERSRALELCVSVYNSLQGLTSTVTDITLETGVQTDVAMMRKNLQRELRHTHGTQTRH